MSNTAAASAQGVSRAGPPGKQGVPGRLTVGDYVEQPAAAAAQAVRRAGLRPALDRAFGCEEHLTGLVVAQSPPSGSELARNAMVTLHIAAPGATAAKDTDELPDRQTDRAVEPVVDGLAREAASDGRAQRRMRKPGLALGEPNAAFDPAPDPMTGLQLTHGSDEPLRRYGRSAEGDVGQSGSDPLRTFDFEQEARHQRGADELSHDEFVMHTEDVFGARAGRVPPWRRMYPSRPRGRSWRGPLVWIGRHAVFAIAACAMLAVWIAVAALATVSGGRAVDVTSAPGLGARIAAAVAGAAPTGAAASRPMGSSLFGQARSHASARELSTPVAAAASGVPAKVAVASSPSPAPAARTAAPPDSAPEQTGGGPFSP